MGETAAGKKSTVYEVDNSQAEAEAAAAEALRKKQAEEAEQKAKMQRDLEEIRKKQEAEVAEAKRLKEEEELKRQLELEKSKVPPAPKGMSFIAMKMHLKKNGVDRNRVDNCLGKYELEKLAAECGIEFP